VKPAIPRKLLYAACVAAAPFLLLGAVRGSTTLASSVLEKRYPPPGPMIPVGDHRMLLYCTGNGSPTVVIEPGMGVDWVSWWRVIPKLAESTRVCVYDRAGYGWSEAGPMPRTAGRIADELHSLLSNAHAGGPYILAAFSFGGYIARIYASRFPESLSGVVLVDPSIEDEEGSQPNSPHARHILELVPPLGTARLARLYKGENDLPAEIADLPPAFRNRYLIASSLVQLRTERNEFDNVVESAAEAHAAVFPRQLPLTVITAMLPRPAETPGVLSLRRESQGRLARSSIFGRQILAENSGHTVSLDQPNLIVDAILELARRPR
jgi:pimeloyl-ACP methyl ester carboxylesterase